MNTPHHNTKTKLLDAAISIIRTKGYSATTVDDLCAAAQVTKGAFFHHFKSKEELGVAAADYWATVTGGFFETAPYHQHANPLDRVLGYLEFRKTILQGELADFTCLVGTMVQETFDTSPLIREACKRSIIQHAAEVESDIAEAMQLYAIDAQWTAKSLALYTQAVIQGAFILAKATQSHVVAADCIDHLHRYVKTLFPARFPPHTGARR
jgi:TetR/AcrR family transcriptional repressor of nem operon